MRASGSTRCPRWPRPRRSMRGWASATRRPTTTTRSRARASWRWISEVRDPPGVEPVRGAGEGGQVLRHQRPDRRGVLHRGAAAEALLDVGASGAAPGLDHLRGDLHVALHAEVPAVEDVRLVGAVLAGEDAGG